MENQQAFVLRIAPSGNDRVEEALEKNYLIIGWAWAEGLLDETLEWEEFREIVRRKYYPNDDNLRKAGNAAAKLWYFIRDMKKEDLIVVPHGSGFYVGKVAGPAVYDESKANDDSAYRRPVDWLNGKKPIPRTCAKAALISRMKTYGTCADATDLIEQIKECLEIAKTGDTPSFENDLENKLVDKALEELRSGRMEDWRFEKLIETVLGKLGAKTRIVPRNKDVGIDIYATFLVAGIFQLVVGIQAKHWKPEPPVGADVVDQLIRGIEKGGERVTLGMVITSGTFSPDATSKAEEYGDEKGIPIELVDGEQFAKLIVEHGLGVMRVDSE